MVERRIELTRRHKRKGKMRKLKTKLAAATGEAREKVMYKIKRLSPWWTEDCLKQAEAAKAGTAAAPAPKAEKKKAPPKKKA